MAEGRSQWKEEGRFKMEDKDLIEMDVILSLMYSLYHPESIDL